MGNMHADDIKKTFLNENDFVLVEFRCGLWLKAQMIISQHSFVICLKGV